MPDPQRFGISRASHIYRGYEKARAATSGPQSFLDKDKAYRKYLSQKHGARARGVGWELSFQQWLDWWGDDLDKRGRGRFDLSMQRIADTGPYSLDNIRKGSPAQNANTRWRMQMAKESAEARKAQLLRELQSEPAATDTEEPTEDDGMPDLGYSRVSYWS